MFRPIVLDYAQGGLHDHVLGRFARKSTMECLRYFSGFQTKTTVANWYWIAMVHISLIIDLWTNNLEFKGSGIFLLTNHGNFLNFSFGLLVPNFYVALPSEPLIEVYSQVFPIIWWNLWGFRRFSLEDSYPCVVCANFGSFTTTVQIQSQVSTSLRCYSSCREANCGSTVVFKVEEE